MKQMEQFTYLVYGHITSKVNVVNVKLLHKMAGEKNKLILKSWVDFSRLPRTSMLCSHIASLWIIELPCTKKLTNLYQEQ